MENDLISRQGVIEVLSQYPFEKVVNCISIIEEFPSAQPYTDTEIQTMQDLEQAQLDKAYQIGVESTQTDIILCKDCKHRPTRDEDGWLDFPTERCPCQNEDDYYYSWMPKDDWFCGNAERREG